MGSLNVISRYSRVVLVLCLLGAAPSLVAQNYDNPGLGERPVATHPQDFKPLGVRAGGFMLHPGVQLAAEYTDNVFYTASDTVSDTVWHVRPYLSAQSNWSRHSFNVRLAADIARYDDFSFRDYEDYFLLINGRVDVQTQSYFSYSADYMRLHEDLSNRDAEQGAEPTTYEMMGGSLGYDHTFNRLSVGVDYAYRKLDFDDVLSLDGEVIDNRDRDRGQENLTLDMGYQFQSDKQAFLSLSSRDVSYDQPFDRNGYRRDNSGWNASAGLAFAITNLLDGRVFATYHDNSYDDPRLNGLSGWAGGLSLSWIPTRRTSVGASISSSVQETTYEFASGYLSMLYSLRVDYELLRDLQLSGRVSYRDNQYKLTNNAPVGAREDDSIWQAGLGLSYFVNRHIFLSASYNWQQLDSNVAADGFEVNRLWLTLSFER